LKGLKEAITHEVAAIPPEMTRRVMENYRERLNQCIDNEGRHSNDVVLNFKTALCIVFKVTKNILLGFVFISFRNRGVLSAASCNKNRNFNGISSTGENI
jgi:hypothetical protein